MALPSMTLAELRTAVRQRVDMENSEFVTDSELNGYINNSLFELYDLLVTTYGPDYYVADPYSFTTDGTSERYSLPTDFYKLLGVDLLIASGAPNQWFTLQPFTMQERNRFNVAGNLGVVGLYSSNLRYRLNANKLWLMPVAAAGQTIRLWYVPKMTPLTSDSDSTDGISGWLEYVIIDAGLACLRKQQDESTPVFERQKEMLRQRIIETAPDRDAGMPFTDTDVSPGNNGLFGTYSQWRDW